MNAKIRIITLLLTLSSVCISRAQQMDIGLKLLFVSQEGALLNNLTYGYGSSNPIQEMATCIGGHFGIYQPFLFTKSKNVSLGVETGLYYAYNKKKRIREQNYFDLKVKQSRFGRSLGAIDIPLMAAIRSGKFSGPYGTRGRNLGIAGGVHLLHFYVSNERGTLITPAVSGIFGIYERMFIRVDVLTRAYQSEYETTLGSIPRLTNKFWSLSLHVVI